MRCYDLYAFENLLVANDVHAKTSFMVILASLPFRGFENTFYYN
jgi:hypothetical protein